MKAYQALLFLCAMLASCRASAPTLALSTPKPHLEGPWTDPEAQFGKEVLPGVVVLTGADLQPFQTSFRIPELADPYVTLMKDFVMISGTAQYYLKFRTLDDVRKGGPYQVVWNDYYYPDGTPMEGNRYYASSWDLKPSLWVSPQNQEDRPRLWTPGSDRGNPETVWYGGHMRPAPGATTSQWATDNFSRDVFAFTEARPGLWFSQENSIFGSRANWPRATGNYLGHRYGHQIVMIPKLENDKRILVPAVFYEEVTDIRADGSPASTKIFMDEMATPMQAKGSPVELISPIHPLTGKPYPSAIREDGANLVEGPLYFRFTFAGEEWEAIGFSAGSFYGKYPACFASRKVSDGLQGKPFQIDLNDDGTDFHDAGAELGTALNLAGGPGRPAVVVGSDGAAIPGPQGLLQVLVHGYRKDVLPDNDYTRFPTKYRLDQMYRVMIHASLQVSSGPRGALRFDIVTPRNQKPNWGITTQHPVLF